MLYLLVRIVAIVVLSLIFLMSFKRVLLGLKRKNKMILLGIFLISNYILLLFPFENMILKFNSPIDAFNYMYFNQNVIQVIEDNNCAFIVYGQDGSSVSYTTVQNQDGKWKIHSPYTTSNIRIKGFDKYIVVTYHVEGSNKTLIVVSEGNLSKSKSDIEISDNKNSQFKSFFSKYKHVDYYTVFNYTVINTNINDYQLKINNESLKLN